MAFPNLSEIVTTTLRSRTGELADNMSRNNALLARLNKRGKIKTFSGGRTIVQELNYANNQTFQWYSGYQTLNIAPSQTFSAAEYPIRQSAVAVSISGLEELQNSGEEAIIDLLESRIENAEDTFMNGMSQGIYGDGTVTGSVNGLQLLVAASPGSGLVGGIDRSTWTFWQNQAYSALTNGGAAATAANIQQYMDTIWVTLVRGRDCPDLIVADNNYYKLYWQSLQAIQRIASENGSGEHGALGFQTLKYNTADVVLDGGFQGFSTDPFPGEVSSTVTGLGGAPTNTMYFLNTKYLHWRPHARRNMVPLDPDRFSVNQDAMVKLMGWAGNMTLSNAFLQGYFGASTHMTSYAAQSIEGVDVTGIYNIYNQANAQTSTNSPDYPALPFKLGTRVVTTDGGNWIFADSVTTITNGSVVALNSTFRATAIGGAGAVGATPEATGVIIGFYQNSTSLTTGQAAWFMVTGVPTILVASAGITAPLYSSDTAGTLTGTTNTVSHFQISGITCVVTASGSTASLTATVANSVSVRKPVA